jgi:hypothetical protein
MPLLFRNGEFLVDSGPPLPVYIFQFLETLPNLSDLDFKDLTVRVRLQDLHFFAIIAQQTALRHLSFSSEYGAVASGQPTAGPEGLESISVKWNVTDGQDDPGAAMSHLYEILRPSLGTLTHLELHDYPILGFQALGPACTSLRTLEYTTFSQSPRVLEVAANMFPNVANLTMIFQSFIWMVC